MNKNIEEPLKELAELYEKENNSDLKSIYELLKGTLAETRDELRLLFGDFHSSCLPDPYDPKTEEALTEVCIAIDKKIYTEKDFQDFAEKVLGGGYFAEACKKYVMEHLQKTSNNL